MYEMPLFTYAKTKAQSSCAVTVQLINAFVLLHRYYNSSSTNIQNFKLLAAFAHSDLCESWLKTIKTNFLPIAAQILPAHVYSIDSCFTCTTLIFLPCSSGLRVYITLGSSFTPAEDPGPT